MIINLTFHLPNGRIMDMPRALGFVPVVSIIFRLRDG
jgi:hypothetical protein